MIDPRIDDPPRGGWDAATDDDRLVQLAELLCGLERELALHLLSLMYADEPDPEQDAAVT